jgi:hypothetical protein
VLLFYHQSSLDVASLTVGRPRRAVSGTDKSTSRRARSAATWHTIKIHRQPEDQAALVPPRLKINSTSPQSPQDTPGPDRPVLCLGSGPQSKTQTTGTLAHSNRSTTIILSLFRYTASLRRRDALCPKDRRKMLLPHVHFLSKHHFRSTPGITPQLKRYQLALERTHLSVETPAADLYHTLPIVVEKLLNSFHLLTDQFKDRVLARC